MGDSSVITKVLTLFFCLPSKNWIMFFLSHSLRPSCLCGPRIPQAYLSKLHIAGESLSPEENLPQGRSSPGMQFSSTQEPLPSSLDVRQQQACGMPKCL